MRLRKRKQKEEHEGHCQTGQAIAWSAVHPLTVEKIFLKAKRLEALLFYASGIGLFPPRPRPGKAGQKHTAVQIRQY
jgi:hypothetical protein